LLKLGGSDLAKKIFKLTSLIWHKKENPVEWGTSIICPIVTIKKGNPKCVKNYRGFSSLLDVIM